MNSRQPLPPQLQGRAFSVGEALSLGVHPDRLRASDLAKPFHGARLPAGVDGGTGHLSLCRAYLPALPPNGYFSHASAAAIMGIPLPARVARSTVIHVSLPPGSRGVRTRDVAGHVLDAGPHDLRMWGDLPLTGPERTWCDLAGALSLRQLVAAGDHLIHHRQPLTTPHELRAAVDRFAGHRGVRALRAALPLLSDRAESPAESELRVVLALAGLPTPLVNHEIRTRTGRFIARVDLLFPENRLVVEYQGDHHRTDQKQWRRDLARAAELESERYRVTEVTADDLRSEPALIARIRRLLSFPVPLSRHESGV